MKLDYFFTAYTESISKCVSDLYDGSKTKKFLEENIGVNICDLWHETPKIQATTEKKIN